MTADDTQVYTVPEISCDHCRRAIEQHVGPVAGVRSVTVDVEAGLVTVTGGDPAAIEAAIGAAGYAVA
jgi:copper chaperone